MNCALRALLLLVALTTAVVAADDGARIAAAESALREAPSDVDRMLTLARRLALAETAANRDPVRAVRLAREALLQAPEQARCWETLAIAHYAAGAYAKALRAAERMQEQRKARGLDLTLEQEELLTRCRTAAEAFRLMEPKS